MRATGFSTIGRLISAEATPKKIDRYHTGMYEPVAQIAAALDKIQADTGLDIKIHVDGASGAMIAPFVQPKLTWDFALDRVVSINTSGHKYGLVYPGIGWVVWRDRAALPEDLIFHVS